MTHQEAIEKAVKLLRLAQSSNQHEAALAASRAQEIMDRFKLEGLSADYATDAPKPSEPIKDFCADLMDPGTQVETWKARLASVVAKVNECKIYIRKTRNIRYEITAGFAIVGRASDAQTVRYIYSWLSHEVDRLAGIHCAGYGRTFFNNFRIGAVEAVCDKLEAARKATEATMKQEAVATGIGMALVRVQNAIATRDKQLAEVEDWTKANLKLKKAPRTTYTADPTARQLGRRAGETINVRPRQQLQPQGRATQAALL